MTQPRPCPICASTHNHKLFRQQFTSLSAGSILNGYDVVVCAQCGLAYADGLPAQEEFDSYYAGMSKYEHNSTNGQISPMEVARFAAMAEMISSVLADRSAPILDVGCATGGLLAALRDHGYSNLLGLDPSPVCATLAKEAFDVEVVTGAIDTFDTNRGPFSLICFSAVIEHLCRPKEQLTALQALLADDGLLLIEVPDAARFAEFIDAPYQQFSIEHINFFTQQSLDNLMAQTGFSPVICRDTLYHISALSKGPAICAIYRKFVNPPISKDEISEPALREYIAASAALERHIEREMTKLAESQQPVIVWGVGTHTLRLLATTRLAEANIVAFIDSNPVYQGKQLNGIDIIAPEKLANRDEPILISTCVYQEEIAAQISDDLGYANPLIRLYGEVVSRP